MGENKIAAREDARICNVFISWTGNDRALKDTVKAYLEKGGIYCPDSEEACAGNFETWSAESGSAGSLFLLLLTPNSYLKEYVGMEVESAKRMEDAANRILPITTTLEFYRAHGFGLGEDLKCSAITVGERSGAPCNGGYLDSGELPEEKLREILDKVKSLLANRASLLFRDRTYPRHMKLAPYFRRMRRQGVSQVPFDSLYVERTVAEETGEGEETLHETPAPILQSEVSFLYGAAGSGKSRYIDQIRLFAKEGDGDRPLPQLILTLPCAALAAEERHLKDVLFERFRAGLGATEFYSKSNFRDMLAARERHGQPLLLVFDGLDEVATAGQKAALLERIEEYHRENKGIFRLFFTSRNPNDGAQIAINGKTPRVFRLVPLEDGGVRQLCEKLFLLFGDEEGGNAFYVDLATLSAEIRQNPLLLSQLAIVYKEKHTLPKTEFDILDAVREITFRREPMGGEKYPDLLDGIEGWLSLFARERYRLLGMGETYPSEAVFSEILEPAYPMDYRERARFLVDYLEDRALFVDDGFYHKVFLEYFAAVRYYEESFNDYGKIKNGGVIAELFSHYEDPYWEKLLKLFLMKADSKVGAEGTVSLYLAILSADIQDYTLLLEACRDFLRNGKEARGVIVSDLLERSATSALPPYGPLFWFVPEFGLFEDAIRALGTLGGEAYSAALALVRDVCFLFSGCATAKEICPDADGKALMQSAKLCGVRQALCELFYLGKTQASCEELVYPRLFSVAETRERMEKGQGVFQRMLAPFADELGLYTHGMLPTVGEDYMGLLSLPYDGNASQTLTARKTRRVRALAWTPTENTVVDYVPFNRSSVETVYLPENVEECKGDWDLHMPLRYFIRCIERLPTYCYNGTLSLPEGVTEIGRSAFANCTALTEIAIPEGVTEIGSSAFERCTALTKVTIPKGVTEIGSSAFERCTALAEVTIPKGMKEIGSSAFAWCTALAEITIPEGVTEIGQRAFQGCTAFIEIVIPEGVTEIGSSAFARCTSLTKITIPESVTEIGESAFEGCTALEVVTIPARFKYRISRIFTDSENAISFRFLEEDFSFEKNESGEIIFAFPEGTEEIEREDLPLYYDQVVQFILPESVTEIEWWAFKGCTSLSEIAIPDGVTKIGGGAFQGCTALTEITIPESVTEIGARAFSGCTSLSKITIPEGVTEIEWRAFKGCTALSEITIPESVTKIREDAFAGCTALSEVTIPASVTEIGSGAFRGCTALTEITIPEGVTKIGYRAFQGCTALREITIPKGVTEIGSSAFWGCTALSEITIPESVTEIGSSAFWGCTALAEITIPASVTEIGYEAFERCTALTEITFPKGMTEIGSSAFRGCTALEVVTIPARFKHSISRIFTDSENAISFHFLEEDFSFEKNANGEIFFAFPEGTEKIECEDLPPYYYQVVQFILPEGVKVIGRGAFSGCTALTKIVIPEGVTEIGEDAFKGCAALSEITIPASVTEIGDCAFEGCTALTEIAIPASVTEIGYEAFERCTALTEITLPKGMTEIRAGAFEGCTALTEVTIPESVTEIGTGAFYGCTALTEIAIPKGVTKIGESIFRDCTALSEITIPISVRRIEHDAFDGCTSLKKVTLSANFRSEITAIFGEAADPSIFHFVE